MSKDAENVYRLMNWCDQMNAGIRFESNGTVSVWANGRKRRRPSFVEAAEALRKVFAK